MMIPCNNEGFRLFMEGQIALAQVENAGMKINMEYLDRKIEETEKRIRNLSQGLRTDKDCQKVVKAWRKRYGGKTNFGSREQLGTVLFEVLQIEGAEETEKSKQAREADKGAKVRWKADKDAIEDINLPFVQKFLTIEKLKKALSTYLMGIRREVDQNGFLHPSYALNTVVSFRSSVTDPNTQNIPIRDEDVANLIRPAFIPRKPTWQFVERDFSGIEVKTVACNCKDSALIKYVSDKTTDMHRDLAQQLFFLKKKQVSKKARYISKNGYVFPEFYGDFWASCAKSLWTKIDRMEICTEQGIPLKTHLRNHGITKLGTFDPDSDPEPGTFMRHVKAVEKDFWGRRFCQYANWKRSIYEEYCQKGEITTLTGFRLTAIMNTKQVSNYGPQGDAFHCLLWCLVRLQKLMRKYHFRGKITGQIHDSILSDIPSSELKDYAEISEKVMSQDLPKHYKWICVPFESELEAAPPGENWLNKKPYTI